MKSSPISTDAIDVKPNSREGRRLWGHRKPMHSGNTSLRPDLVVPDPDAVRWRVDPREAALVRALLPGVTSQEGAAAEAGVPKAWVHSPAVRRALAEARAEVSVRAQLTAEKVIVELLDIEREARAAGQYSAAVRAVEVAAKIGGLFVERSVSVSLAAPGNAHVAALMEKMKARRATPPALTPLPAPLHLVEGGSAAVVTFTETRAAVAFDGFDIDENA